MDFFWYSSSIGAKSLIEYHFWKYELDFETFELYSSFINNAHVLLGIHKNDNLVCVYSSIHKYKVQSYNNLLVLPEYSLSNDTFSLKVTILNCDDRMEPDEDVMYECFSSMSIACSTPHKIYFNSFSFRNYDWNMLKSDTDYTFYRFDEKSYNEPYYMVKTSPYVQLLCNKKTASLHCKHMSKRIANITAGYKQISFDVNITKSFVCPCSMFLFFNETCKSSKYNYVLLSYKLSQFMLNF